MSDQESFLSRWSRLKREAQDVAPAPAPAADAANVPAPPAQGDDAAPPNEEPASEVDVEALPPIESITAATDIRAFLAPGIPAHLTRAALRRAWAADPAIRDFVGLAENAWDFNDPAAVPGFGSIMPAEQAQSVVADLIGKADPAPSPRREGEQIEKPDVGPEGEQASCSEAEKAAAPEQAGEDSAAQEGDDVAAQDEHPADGARVRLGSQYAVRRPE